MRPPRVGGGRDPEGCGLFFAGQDGLIFGGDFGGDREVAVFDDDFLTFFGGDELQELRGQRVHGGAGFFVHVDVEETGQRVITAEAVFVGGGDLFAVWFGGERQGAHAGRDVADSRVTDAVLVGAGAAFLNDGDLVQVAAPAAAGARK